MYPKLALRVVFVALGIVSAVARAAAPDAPLADPTGINKVRFISMGFPPPPQGQPPETALRVWLTSLHHVDPPYAGGPTNSFALFEGQWVWVGPPQEFVESVASGIPFWSSETRCSPHYQDWSTIGLLHVRGSHIVPSSIYHVEQVPIECVGNEDDCPAASPSLEIRTTRWADIEDEWQPPATSVQPDFSDISAILYKFRGAPGAAIKARVVISMQTVFGEIESSTLNIDVGLSPLARAIDAYRGEGYGAKAGKCAGTLRYCAGNPAISCITSTQCSNAKTTGPCLGGETACLSDSECGLNAPCNLYCPD